MKLFILLLSIFSSSTYAESESLKRESVARFITLPITQVGTSTANVTVEKLLSILQDRVSRVGRKYGYSVPVAEESKLNARASGSLQMGDGPSDFIYFATVVVGTPGVSFEVQLDTGSSDLILISNPCYSGCTNSTPVYRPSDSSTAQVSNQPFTIEYGSGAATGKLVRDVVSFGNFKINQIFGALQNSQGIYHSSGGISGILGLAFATIAQSGATPFIQALYEAGALDQPLFTMAFSRWKSNSVNPGGIMTIGAVDTTLYSGTITYTPSSASDYWEIPLDNVSLNGNSLNISSTDTLIDSGTSLIYFPQAQASLFYSHISGSSEAGGGIWRYPCAAVPVLGLTFGGRLWNVSVTDFNLGYATSDGRLCYGAVAYFQGADSLWIFGDVFLKNVYSVFQFNPSSIGFATLANSAALRNGFVPTGNGITVGQGGNNTSILPSSASTSTSTPVSNSASLKSSTTLSSPPSSASTSLASTSSNISKTTTPLTTTINNSSSTSVLPTSSKPLMGGAAPTSSPNGASTSTRYATITTTTTTTSSSSTTFTVTSKTASIASSVITSSMTATVVSRNTTSSTTASTSIISSKPVSGAAANADSSTKSLTATTSTRSTSSLNSSSTSSKASITSNTPIPTSSTIKSSTATSATTSKAITSPTISTTTASTANAKVAAVTPTSSSSSTMTGSSKTTTTIIFSNTSSLSKSTTNISTSANASKSSTSSISGSAAISRSTAVNANAKVGTSTTSTSSTIASIKTYTFTSTNSGHTYTSTVTSTSSSLTSTSTTTIKPTTAAPTRRAGKYRHIVA